MKNNKFMEKDAAILFEAAKDFNNVKPWQWLGDTDVFGIKFHDVEDIIFCSVLGSGDEVYGMAVYLGIDGIDSYFKILLGEFDLEEEMLHIQNALTINFDDRQDITNADYALIKMSGVNFRGKKQWPTFRRYEPGFVPWSLNDEELLLMIRILEAAKQAVLYYKVNSNKAALMQEGKCSIIEINADGSYKEKTIEYDKLEDLGNSTIEIPITYDELAIKRLNKRCKHTKDIWEMDSFFHVSPVKDEGIPFFPEILFVIDKNKDFIIGNHMAHPYYIAEEFQQYLLSLFSNNNSIPAKIIFSNRRLFMYLEDLLCGLGINVELTERLEIMPEIKKEFFYSMRGR